MTAAVALAAAAVPSPSRAQSPPPPAAPLLDVPYLPQSEALCGAAAIAMVMRYWGTPAVYAETFADLVDAEAGGIRGRDLIRALHDRGFQAASFEGDAASVQAALNARRPPIALIEDRPGRFHYVVIVGWRADRVIVHDPARAPFRVLAADAFLRAWSASQYWTLLAEPLTPQGTAAPVDSGAPIRSVPRSELGGVQGSPPSKGSERSGARSEARAESRLCAGMVDEGVRLAGAGDLAASQRVLELAAADCPKDPGPWRELAGVHALRGDWKSAASEARRALDRDPADAHAARILATSHFLDGRDADALDAWNRIGAPVVDLTDIKGLERTRFAVAASALDLPPETLLTAGRLARARRRLAALPSVIGSRVSYKPGEDDRAQVVAAVMERPLVPSGLLPLAASALKTVTDRELALAVASPTGGGELWSASWRWWERRPRIAAGVVAPSPFGGIWSLEVFGERQTYGAAASEISERRRGVALRASDWISGSTRIEAGATVDRWDAGTTASLEAAVERVFASGRVVAGAGGTLLTGTHKSNRFDLTGAWRSADGRTGAVWHARGGLTAAASGAPLAFWPGAGTGQGREVLLRAHPLLHDGAIRGVFGRRLVHGGVEWRYWTGPVLRTLHVAPAIFVDVARALRPHAFGDARAHVDAGAGLRVAIPGAGVLRVDLGRGLRDGKTALSFGWTR